MIEDNKKFQNKFGFDEKPLTREQLRFRMTLLMEEMKETLKAYNEKNAEEWVDGHVDILVIALGNLHLAGVDVEKAWDEVFRANMSKVRGVKEGREESGGFDVLKPKDWVAPSHAGNHGILTKLWRKIDVRTD